MVRVLILSKDSWPIFLCLKNNFARPGLLLAGFQTKVQVFKESHKALTKSPELI